MTSAVSVDPAPLSERRQFAALYRNFLLRVIDLELLSASGDVRTLLAQFASLLAAYSFVLALFTVPSFALSTASHANLLVGAWGVEEFLISTTLTVTGLFSVLAWNAIIPDRRDTFVLNPLPLRARSAFGAKCAATAATLCICVVAVNVFTGLSFPFLVASEGARTLGAVRSLLAYWATMAAAGMFTFAAVIALQNVAAACLSYPLFQRISGVLQLLTFFVVLALFFLTPPLATPAALNSPANQPLLTWLPSFWYLGLFNELNGSAHPVFGPLASRALWSVLMACLLALASAGLTYRRMIRCAIEQPDVAPEQSKGALSRFAFALISRLLADPIDRAMLLFSARTLARSCQHRLILAIYVGMAFAIALAYTKSLLYGVGAQRWDQPDVPLLITSLVTLFFAVMGIRAVFALPIALPANWIFRLSAVRSPASYCSATRKSLFVLGAFPVLLCSSLVYLSIWPGRPALQHLLVLLLLAILLVQVSLRKFRKIPFACSYLPGKSNLRLKSGIGAFAFLFTVDIFANIECWSMHNAVRYVVILAFLTVAAIWATRRTAEFSGSPYNRLQFEDAANAEIYALDFRRDSDQQNDDGYLAAVTSPPRRSFPARIRSFLLGASLLVAAGFAYQGFSEWRDRQRFHQVGHSVDIGGRSLNLYCSGFGSPAVVMDSGAGWPGYGWQLVTPGVAKFTRACWYDRAGYGWSDPAPRNRSAADVANDLHSLVHSAGIRPPYLLVGHSLGGFHVRVFAARYATEVAGLVLVDSADEYEERMHPGIIPEPLMPVVAKLFRFGVHAGVLRVVDNGVEAPEGLLPLRDTLIVHALRLQPKSFDASLNEGLSRPETLRQVKAVKSLGSIPIVVLTGAKKPELQVSDEPEAELLNRFMEHRVHVTQANLAALSTRGRQIILPNVGHGIPTEAPAAIVDAVRDLISLEHEKVEVRSNSH